MVGSADDVGGAGDGFPGGGIADKRLTRRTVPLVESVDAHRRHMRQVVLDATAAVVAEHGLDGLTMARIAARAGVAEVRLRRHFGDLDAIMRAWHDRQLGAHLAFVADAGDQIDGVMRRLDAVLRAYAAIMHQTHEHRATDRWAELHQDEHHVHARRHLLDLIRSLLTEGVATGEIRDDVPADDLADYCVRTLFDAGDHSSAAAVRQLVTETMAQLQPGEG